MKLILTKNQSKGIMGGISFEVKAKVELTQEEQNLIKHYKLENEILLSKKKVFFGQTLDETVQVSVKNLLNGESYKCKDLGEVITYSDNLKSACNTLWTYLNVARGFGGQEIIEIPDDEDDEEAGFAQGG